MPLLAPLKPETLRPGDQILVLNGLRLGAGHVYAHLHLSLYGPERETEGWLLGQCMWWSKAFWYGEGFGLPQTFEGAGKLHAYPLGPGRGSWRLLGPSITDLREAHRVFRESLFLLEPQISLKHARDRLAGEDARFLSREARRALEDWPFG